MVNLVFSLLVLLYIWPSLIVDSSDSFEKQSSNAKQPSLAEDLNNIENYKHRKCEAKEQSSSTMKFDRKIKIQKGWRPSGKWKIGVELIFHNQLSHLSGKFYYKLYTNNSSLSMFKSNRTLRQVRRGFGIGNLLKHEGKRSNEKCAKPRAKIKIKKQNGEADDELEEAVHELKPAVDDSDAPKAVSVAKAHFRCELPSAAELLMSDVEMAKDAELQMREMRPKEGERQLCVKDEELATPSPNVIVLSGPESEIFLNLSKDEDKKYLKILSYISEIFLNLSKREYFTKFLKKLVSGIRLEKGKSKKGAIARGVSARVCKREPAAADAEAEAAEGECEVADAEAEAVEREPEAADAEAEAAEGEC